MSQAHHLVMVALQFRYPLPFQPRIAVWGLPFSSTPSLHLAAAETVAAPVRALLNLPIHGWTPIYPVVAFTGAAHGFLTEHDRDRIWRRWGVPVFEQLLSPGFQVLAEECDAHEGLHLAGGVELLDGELTIAGVPVGLIGELATDSCPCGRPEPRLLSVSPAVNVAAACA